LQRLLVVVIKIAGNIKLDHGGRKKQSNFHRLLRQSYSNLLGVHWSTWSSICLKTSAIQKIILVLSLTKFALLFVCVQSDQVLYFPRSLLHYQKSLRVIYYNYTRKFCAFDIIMKTVCSFLKSQFVLNQQDVIF